MNRAAKQDGFTLIELVLAMAFISALLLAIALTIIQIGTTYNRGMTLKEVNQTARSISDELTRNLTSSEAFTLSSKYISTPTGGRLCLGQAPQPHVAVPVHPMLRRRRVACRQIQVDTVVARPQPRRAPDLCERLVHARRIGAAYVSTRPFMIERVFRAAHGGVRCEGGSVVVSLFPRGLIFLAYYNRPVPF